MSNMDIKAIDTRQAAAMLASGQDIGITATTDRFMPRFRAGDRLRVSATHEVRSDHMVACFIGTECQLHRADALPDAPMSAYAITEVQYVARELAA